MISKGRCHSCAEHGDRKHKPVVLVNRKVGGAYNRAPASRPCNICEECARTAAERVVFGDGRLVVDRWSKHGIVRAVEQFDAERDRLEASKDA